MTRAWPGALLALQAFLIVLAARPGWRDDLWGFNFPSFLPAGTLALIGVLAIGLMIALRLGRPRGRWGTLLAGLIITAIVVMLRDTTHLLGDGQLWLAAVREAPAHHPHEPFAFALSSVVAGADTTGTRLAWLSHALGMATLALLWILAGRLLPPSPDGMARRWAFAVMATAGASLFAFGYVEAYPALGLAVVGLLVALIGWLEGRNGAAVVGLLFGLAVGTHALALALGPAVLLAFWWRRPTASRLLAAALLALVPIAVAWVVLPLVLPAGGLS